ncbi:HPF/RaiA family ribosome-associated protein [Methyloversatilis sp. XJ19-49]|uniref:HPF/RaiA family ribosome-associated protein n=1 Tax=Methyloversatilis sp. XJ19-49 TaxID=2963429 RepID=UPI00211C1065|nr:HPF/RaiA family ribosome-associated protein [Methyloversatilis sp. XJ19-49]MCQ9379899.1 HPF/RaiA family ribosome-associated protein [Methyloversatilis sp. XJ19-49]
MKIQLNTDVHIEGNEALAAQVSATVGQALERFSEHVTRVEVHLSDENGDKSGQQDQRCMLEARLEGRQPVVVTDYAATPERALHGAVQKLVRLLDSTLGRLHDQRDNASGPATAGTEPAAR